MKRSRRFFALLATASVFALTALAGDPAGRWKWSITTPNGDTFEISLKLELKDGRLTGTYASPLGEAVIRDTSFKDETIAFDVEREFNGNKFVIKYRGRLEGDTIKGIIEMPGWNGGEPVKMDWNAVRAK